MSKKRIVPSNSVVLVLFTALMLSCGAEESEESNESGVVVAATFAQIPRCKRWRAGTVYYVQETDEFFFCNGKRLLPIDLSGQDGEDGQDGSSCTVVRDDEAGTSTITCEDGTVAVVRDGLDAGAGGTPGGTGGTPGGTGGTPGGTGGAPGGTGGSPGGTGGTPGGGQFAAVSVTIDLCCNNSAAPQQSTLSVRLDVDPGTVVPGGEFTAELSGGLLTVPERLLDLAQRIVPGGVTELDLVQGQVTVLPRSGSGVSGAPTPISPIFPSGTCLFDDSSCNVENNVGGIPFGFPGYAGNTDCVPSGNFNPCRRLFTVPTANTAEACAGLDPAPCGGTGEEECVKSDQFSVNDFCVSGPVEIPLATVQGNYTPGSVGETMLFGWDDQNTSAVIVGSDVTIGSPFYSSPIGPNGMRFDLGGLSIALECVMAIETGVSADGVTCGLTPDDRLVGSGVAGTEVYTLEAP